MLELNIIGWPQIRLAGELLAVRPRRLLFFSFLALEGPVDRGKLAACFWDGLDPEVARSRLRLELHRIAHSDLGAFLQVSGESVEVRVQCDARDFIVASQSGRWDEMARMYRGPLLSNQVVDVPALQFWLETTRVRYAEHVRLALEELGAAADRQGDPVAALAAERRLLDIDPYAEATCARVSGRLRSLGRPEEAAALEVQFQARYRADVGEPARPVAGALRCLQAQVRPRAPRPTIQDPPCVGRELILRQLDGWLSLNSPVVLLTGEGGVGKTRLVEEWLRRRGEEGLVLRGGQLGRSVPFSVVGEALHRIGEVRLRALAPDLKTELASLWPELVPDQRKKRASSKLRLLEAISEALFLALDGTVMVLDDLHWFDPSSVQVLHHALGRWRQRGTVPRLLATARPGELADHAPALAWLQEAELSGHLIRSEVLPLSEVAVLQLIRQLSGSQQATGFARKLHGLSGGNAYALLAFLQGLEDQGALQTTGEEGWSLTLDLNELNQYLAPPLRDRLCRMVGLAGQPVLRWMEAAALLSPPFEFGVAQAGSGLAEIAALSALDHALAHRWIVRSTGSGYRLSHDLLLHALQGQLQPDRARVIHRRIAQHLERPGANPAQVALHLEGCGERSRAYGFWTEAARLAASVWAHGEALALLGRALACQDDPREQIEVRQQRCTHFKALNDLDGWSAELDRLALVLEDADVDRETSAARLAYVCQRTQLLWRQGDLAQALAFSEPWSQGEASNERVGLLHDRAQMLYQLDRYREASDLLLGALGQLGPGRDRLAANLHNAMTLCALELGQVDAAREHSARAIRMFAELGLLHGLASAHGNRAMVWATMGDRAAQRHALEQALSYAAEGRNVFLERQCLEALCDVVTEDADWSLGLELATRGLELCESSMDQQGVQAFQVRIDGLRRNRAQTEQVATVMT